MIFEKYRNIVILTIVGLACLASSRGFFRTGLLAGHDARAYAVTQQQFHRNISAGVLYPRWAPDMRYGYGHIKLQYRPPLLHYLAEPFYVISENPFASVNAAVIILTFLAGYGMFFCCRNYMKATTAMVGAVAYVTFNYFLGDLYIRGAYYEVAAYACIPWVLWAQTGCFRWSRPSWPLVIGALAWAGLICGHPQIFAFFLPLAAGHFLFTWNETRKNRQAGLAVIAGISGLFLAAPYWYVAVRELPWVRMEIFYVSLEAYTHHFVGLWELLLEKWPAQYSFTSWFDYLGRPRHLEMRSLNWWVWLALILVPCFWQWRKLRTAGEIWNRRFNRLTLWLWISFFVLILLALPCSRGSWFIIKPLHNFNFPWRVLAVAGGCAALLLGLLADELRRRFWIQQNGLLLCLVLSGMLLISAWPKSEGWQGVEWLPEAVNSEFVSITPGIPQQFYTPATVRRYAWKPAASRVVAVEGKAEVQLRNRTAVEWQIQVDAETPARIAVAQYYYPGWKIFGLGEKSITPHPSAQLGEITFEVPAGKHDLSMRFTLTGDRKLAYAFSGLSLLLLAGVVVWLKKLD